MSEYQIKIEKFKGNDIEKRYSIYDPLLPKIDADDEGKVAKVVDGEWTLSEDETGEGGGSGKESDVIIVHASVTGSPVVDEDDTFYACASDLTAKQVYELGREGKTAMVRITVNDQSGSPQILSMPLVRAIVPASGQYNVAFTYMEAAVDTPGCEYPIEYTFELETKNGVETTPSLQVHKVRTASLATKETPGLVIAGDGTKIESNGKLSVDVANDAEADNTRPISSAAVYTLVGNINTLLETI